MLHENTFKKVDFKAAKGLVFIGNKIITYRRDQKTNFYPLGIDLPGGLCEENESPFETFKCEVKEEFGVTIEKEDIYFSNTYKIPTHSNNKESYFIITKPLTLHAVDIVFGNEGAEWFLMSPDEFVARSDGIKKYQEEVAKYLNRNVVSE